MAPLLTIRSLVVAFCLYFGLSVLASWPLLLVSNTHFPSDPAMPDLQTAIWLPDHVLQQLWRFQAPTDGAMLNHPYGQSLRTVIWNFGVPYLQAPLYAVTHAVQAYNLSLLLLSALNGLGGYVLGATVGQRRSAGAVAAAALVFSPYVWSELAQGRCEQGLLLWLLLSLAGAVSLWRAPSRRAGVLTGLAWGASGVFYWFYGYFLLLFFGALGAAALLQRDRERSRALLIAAGTSALCAAPLAVPILAEVLQPDSSYQRALGGLDAARSFQATFSIGVRDLAWWAAPPHDLFAMVPLAVLLGLLACASRRVSWPLLGLGLGGLLLALGPCVQWTAGQPVLVGGGDIAGPMAAFQNLVPGFGRLWWPYRLISLSLAAGAAGLAVLVASAGRRGPPLAVALVALLAAEHRAALGLAQSRLLWDQPAPLQVPAFFAALSGAPGQSPLFMLPYRGFQWSGLLWVPYHRQPISSADGYSEDFTYAPEHLALIQASPARGFLQEAARLPPSAPVQAPPPGVGAALRAEGYRYAVLQRGPEVRAARYSACFVQAPIYEDAVISVWDLNAEP